ncbi:MAG: hypothetical protein H6741_09785 [Alphaproteobacteria bacterium]|nr:hypothetical protein [Alphaproteobacteria bacterium]MCB9793002.1 hypothetical protein [Alphaproteobacteria bacterium]
MRIGIAITRATNVQVTWTTAHIARGLLAAGHEVRFIEPWDFEVDTAGRVVARAHAFDPPDPGREAICQALQQRAARRRYVELSRLDVLLLRINPLDTSVLTFAGLAEREGVVVLNTPSTILRTSHKAYLSALAGVPRPRTMVSRSRSALHAFAADLRTGVVVKPARSSGGRSIHFVPRNRPGELDRAVDAVRACGDGYVVVQEYLKEAEDGEKRLVWLDGRLLGGYLRRRAPGEMRHNLKRGALPEASPLSAEDQRLNEALTPHLRADGVWLAGIDVIGGRVVEVNTLNPGGLHLIQEFSGEDLTRPIVEWLETRAR